MQQLFNHTPLYVWAILAFLVYRGVLASRTREVSLRKLCIIPLVMLALSLSGVHGSFGFDGMAPYAWTAGALAGGLLAWTMTKPRQLLALPQQGGVRVAGSWLPLALMLAIFCMKYAVAVSLAMHPAYAHATGFVLTVCLLYGVFSGLFLGGLLRTLAVYRQAQMTGGPHGAAI